MTSIPTPAMYNTAGTTTTARTSHSSSNDLRLLPSRRQPQQQQSAGRHDLKCDRRIARAAPLSPRHRRLCLGRVPEHTAEDIARLSPACPGLSNLALSPRCHPAPRPPRCRARRGAPNSCMDTVTHRGPAKPNGKKESWSYLRGTYDSQFLKL